MIFLQRELPLILRTLEKRLDKTLQVFSIKGTPVCHFICGPTSWFFENAPEALDCSQMERRVGEYHKTANSLADCKVYT